MHALITADTVGGVWTYARELVTGLAHRGVQVTLVSFGDIPTSAQTSWMEGLRGIDFRPTAFRLEWMQDVEEDIAASAEYLDSVIAEVKPDVVHLNQYAYGALKTTLPKIVVAHSDVVSWWVAVKGEEPRENRWIRWYRDTVTHGVSAADVVVAPTHWMLDCIRAYYTSPEKTQVIYNGRNPNIFNPHVQKEDYVLSVGRLWDAGKQVSLLTQCDQPVPVVIVGSERHPDSAYRGDERSPMLQNVKFEGPKTEGQLRHLYSRAMAYAATSRYEPFGLAPLEAALSRCVVIANDIPSLHEVWGDTAYYFRYNDAQDLSRVILEIACDRDVRLRYANLAYHRARQNYNAERMADEYVALYQQTVRTEITAG
jgi:glycosyltransferase involved in cell wall biosynthesis